MKKQNPKQYAHALRTLTRGKRKNEIDALIHLLVRRFGIMGQIKFFMRVEHMLRDILNIEKRVQRVSVQMPVCDEKSGKALTAQIAKRIGVDVEISFISDPTLIAGAVFTIGDKRYDGSGKARIRQLRRHLEI